MTKCIVLIITPGLIFLELGGFAHARHNDEHSSSTMCHIATGVCVV